MKLEETLDVSPFRHPVSNALENDHAALASWMPSRAQSGA
jgi:hypothetical protein